MSSVLDNSCTENQNSHFMFNTFFPVMPFMRKCGKIWYRQTDRQATHGSIWHICFAWWIIKAKIQTHILVMYNTY
jgi:hypothetical protein